MCRSFCFHADCVCGMQKYTKKTSQAMCSELLEMKYMRGFVEEFAPKPSIEEQMQAADAAAADEALRAASQQAL